MSSTLIPNRQWGEIKAMTDEQRRLMRACEVYEGDVTKDENYRYTHIPRNPYDSIVADNVRTKAEYLGLSTNSIYPPEIFTPEVKAVDLYPHLTKARAARKNKKLALATA